MGPQALVSLVRRALGDLELDRRTGAALDAIIVRDRSDVFSDAVVLAIGKAAPAMAAGALATLARADVRVHDALVVAPDDTDASALPRGTRVLRAAHPIPDRRSVAAGRACLALASSSLPGPRIVLVSGGASALACVPAPGLSLATKKAVTRALLARGAPIRAINTVRRRLSAIKGGGLLRASASHSVVTLVASDVLGGTASDVGSGPSVRDATTRAAALRVLRAYAPEFLTDLPIRRAHRLPPRQEGDPEDTTCIVASPEELALAVGRSLEAHGYDVTVLPPSDAAVEILAAEYLSRARTLRPKRALVRAAEPSVTVRAKTGARGGRSTHLACLVGPALPPGVRLLAFATDGVDGPSETGGAIVDARLFRATSDRRDRNVRVADAVAAFDTGRFLSAIGGALPAHPSGHNLADLHVLVR